MIVKVAKTAGFCMGVRRALDLVFDAAEDTAHQPLYTLGDLIHNKQALEALDAKGVNSAKTVDEIDSGTVVIRAHGAGPSIRSQIDAKNLETIDATCPRVLRCQRAVERASKDGRGVIIAGDREHAEVKAILDSALGPASVLEDPEEAKTVALEDKVTLVAQTTSNSAAYAKMAEILQERLKNKGDDALEVVHSLCSSTEERQKETALLAAEVDAIVVVGGRHSANTCRLAEVAEKLNKPTFHVETADELNPEDFVGIKSVGVTAGASTPAWITDRVVERLGEINSTAKKILQVPFNLLMGGNIFLALGATSMGWAVFLALGMTVVPSALFAVFGFILWAYTTNGPDSSASLHQLSGPRRFFLKYRSGLQLFAAAVSIGAIYLVFKQSLLLGFTLSGAYLFATLYSVRLPTFAIRARDIPGSKDIMIALAWTFVALGVPIITMQNAGALLLGIELLLPIVLGILVLMLALSLALALGLGDIQSDRLIGRESLSVVIGPKRARKFASRLAMFVFIVAMAAAFYPRVNLPILGIAVSGGVLHVSTLRLPRPGSELRIALTVQFAIMAVGPIAFLMQMLMGS